MSIRTLLKNPLIRKLSELFIILTIGSLFIIFSRVRGQDSGFAEVIIWIAVADVCFILTVFLVISIFSKLSPWKQATSDELKKEDSVLIEGIGFIQATILIFLSEPIGSEFISCACASHMPPI